MRKRILAMALSICMAVAVCGCGNKKEADETQTGRTDVTVTGEDTVSSGDVAEEDNEMQVDGIMQESATNMATADCESGFYDDYLQCPDTEEWNTNEYSYTEENPWMNVQTSPISTFAADVDTAGRSEVQFKMATTLIRRWCVSRRCLTISIMIIRSRKAMKNSPCIPSMRIVRGIRIQSLP